MHKIIGIGKSCRIAFMQQLRRWEVVCLFHDLFASTHTNNAAKRPEWLWVIRKSKPPGLGSHQTRRFPFFSARPPEFLQPALTIATAATEVETGSTFGRWGPRHAVAGLSAIGRRRESE